MIYATNMQLKKDREDENIILTDISSKSNKKIQYIRSKDKDSSIKIQASNISSWDYSQWFHSLLKDIFLPKGYPDSVSDDYLEYQIWDTCQAFCSSISGTLTMRAVMQGIGVGSEAANPVSAAIMWIMKDGTGMIGSILFAWLKGSKLDSDCKKWRLFADVLNDIAMFIELYIPFVIEYSMYMLCLSTAFKALVGTAGSSTRAALVTHQAVKGNIADVSAKDGSQEIFTNLCAFVFGVAILKNITETNHIWIVMCTATFFHLFFNYKAVRCLKMNIFNGERFRLSLRTYLPTSCVPTVEQVNRREPVFLGMGTTNRQLFGFSIIFGVSLSQVIQSNEMTADQLSTIVTIFQDKKYVILVHDEKKMLYVAFRKNLNETQVFKAYFHASLIAIAITYLQSEEKLQIITRTRKNSPVYRLLNILQEFDTLQTESNLLESCVAMKAYMACESFIDKEFSAFCKTCRGQGWNIDKHLINIDDWRSDWVYGEKAEDNFLPKAKVIDLTSIWSFNCEVSVHLKPRYSISFLAGPHDLPKKKTLDAYRPLSLHVHLLVSFWFIFCILLHKDMLRKTMLTVSERRPEHFRTGQALRVQNLDLTISNQPFANFPPNGFLWAVGLLSRAWWSAI